MRVYSSYNSEEVDLLREILGGFIERRCLVCEKFRRWPDKFALYKSHKKPGRRGMCKSCWSKKSSNHQQRADVKARRKPYMAAYYKKHQEGWNDYKNPAVIERKEETLAEIRVNMRTLEILGIDIDMELAGKADKVLAGKA